MRSLQIRFIVLLLFFSLCSKQNLFAQKEIKTLKLTAHMLGEWKLYDGNSIDIWGFFYTDSILNPSAPNQLPSPLIELEEGDSVYMEVDNASNLPHTIHLHGMDVGQADDGVPSTSFSIAGYQFGTYNFGATHAGTFLYHCHVETIIHLQMGMYGAVIVRPKGMSNALYDESTKFTKEYLWLGSEIDADWHIGELTNGMQPEYSPNYFLINGKSHDQIPQDPSTSVSALVGDTVLFRIANMGYGINRYTFPAEMNPIIVGSDGRKFDQFEESDTLLVYPGERYGVLTQSGQSIDNFVKVEYLSNFRKKLWGENLIPIKIKEIPLASAKPASEFNYSIRGDEIDLNFQNAEYRHVAIYNLSGKLMSKSSSRDSEITLKLSQQLSGIFIIRVFERNGTYSKKLSIK